jgi:hypothetical protein
MKFQFPQSLIGEGLSRVVIDKNRFESPELRRWLESQKSNIAVLTDYSQMECFEGDAQKNIRSSLSVIRDFPEQILLLHSTQENFSVRPRPPHKLFRRFIDYESTASFPEIIKKFDQSLAGCPIESFDLHQSGIKTNEFIEFLKKDMGQLSEHIAHIISLIPRKSLDSFRNMKGVDEHLSRFIQGETLRMTGLFYKEEATVPAGRRIKHTLAFRYSVSVMALILWWIEKGKTSSKDEYLLSDLIDCTYVAYATICDGLMSDDERASGIYVRAQLLLQTFFP